MFTPERLDQVFPNRRDVTARDGGCSPFLADRFIPTACLTNLTDDQINVLTPRWQHTTKAILAAVPTDLLETEEAQAS